VLRKLSDDSVVSNLDKLFLEQEIERMGAPSIVAFGFNGTLIDIESGGF
jgi:hypothetical protein